MVVLTSSWRIHPSVTGWNLDLSSFSLLCGTVSQLYLKLGTTGVSMGCEKKQQYCQDLVTHNLSCLFYKLVPRSAEGTNIAYLMHVCYS